MSCETSRNVPPAKDVVKRDTIVERWVNKTFTHTPSGKDDVTKRDTSEGWDEMSHPLPHRYMG